MTLDDLRRELREQARESESWPLPSLAHPAPRRTPRWRAAALVGAVAALVAVALVLPGLLGPEGGAPPAARPSEPASISQLPWKREGSGCSVPGERSSAERCAVPRRIVSEGEVLQLTDHAVGDPGDATKLSLTSSAHPGPTWVLAGSTSELVRVEVDLDAAYVETQFGGAHLFRLDGVTSRQVTAGVQPLNALASTDQLTVAFYRPAAEPAVVSWQPPVETECAALEVDCRAPARISAEGRALQRLVLARSEPATDSRDQRYTSSVGNPIPEDLYALVGVAGADGERVVADVGELGSVTLPGDGLQLVRLPATVSDDITIELRASQPSPGQVLVIAWYEPAP